MQNKKLLPVRLVQPSRDFLHENINSGGDVKYFITDDVEFKEHQDYLEAEITHLEKDLEPIFENYPDIPTVIKAKLREKAIAKSHRPTEIFKRDTCPIIGLDKIGEIIISTTKTGLAKLKAIIEKPTSQKQKANITTIEKITKFEDKDKLMGLSFKELYNKSLRKNKSYLKVILFDHHEETINESIKYKFYSWAKEKNIKIEEIAKLNSLNLLRIIGSSEKEIEEITAHPSVRTVSFFPTYRIILSKGLVSSQKMNTFPIPESNKEYPKIAVVDSGISKNHPYLSKWVIDRESFVPEGYQDNLHGCFVGGLISMGTQLNGKGICPDNTPVQIVDIQMLPDPNKDNVSEDDLIERLNSCVPVMTKKHNIRIWNMSAALEAKVEDEQFSSLAIYLDKLQDKNNIIFILPSGNFEDDNQRKWPPQNNINNLDKLQIPADSVRAITVGAIACKEKPDSIVKLNQPASYSCKGPGPTFIPKPEIVHYSGNLTMDDGKMDMSNQGILSFDDEGNIIENIGTSFSCPLGARTMSILHNKLIESTSNNMIKALTIHNSHVPDNLGKVENAFHYVGFGKPNDVESILSCSDSDITLMFEQEIFERHNLTYPFKWPESLKDENGKYRGKVTMTIVANVPLDESYGSEYIRANITATLQEKYIDKEDKEQWRGILDGSPDTKDLCYEKDQIRHFHKWSTIKKYQKEFKRKTLGDLRIQVNLLLRDGIELGTIPVKFALVFTLTDPDGVASVYDEIVVSLRNKGVITNPIQLRSQIQEKIKL